MALFGWAVVQACISAGTIANLSFSPNSKALNKSTAAMALPRRGMRFSQPRTPASSDPIGPLPPPQISHRSDPVAPVGASLPKRTARGFGLAADTPFAARTPAASMPVRPALPRCRCAGPCACCARPASRARASAAPANASWSTTDRATAGMRWSRPVCRRSRFLHCRRYGRLS